MASSAFRDVYDLAFQVSPIILNGGIVSSVPGGMLPVIGLVGQLETFALSIGATGGASADNFYAKYVPLPGATVINNAVGTYPFANQVVAANAVIQQPKNVSLMMIAPVKGTGSYLAKLGIFTALQTSFESHIAAGGTFHIATPAFIFTNCLMTGMTDVTDGSSKQQQIQWKLDFVQPLITQVAAASAFGAQMSKLASGAQLTTSSPSGILTASGTAAQGSLGGISNTFGSINNFMSQPAL